MVKINAGLSEAKRALLSKLKIKDAEVIAVTEESDCILITARHPKPEEWRRIVAFPNYEISDKGQVRDRASKTLMPFGTDRAENPDSDPNAFYALLRPGTKDYPFLLRRIDIFLSTFPEYLGSGHSF
jgi:hypothetical protein